MSRITNKHFGGNLVISNDSISEGSPFREMLNEISFNVFRYPGGTVTEQQTWQNGGLQQIFSRTLGQEGSGGPTTIREALQFSIETGAQIRIVIPTIQFYDGESGSFDGKAYSRYLSELKQALLEFDGAKVAGFEIGNEFWAELTPSEYGFIANKQLPGIADLAQGVAEAQGFQPEVGLQAGASWKWTGEQDSRAIAAEISVENRGHVSQIVQHVYPDAQKDAMDWQADWAVDPMKAFSGLKGFSDDLSYAMTEFNIARTPGEKEVFGVNQAGYWIEEFARLVDSGVTDIDHWGVNYNWLSNKFYDAKLVASETDGGRIVTKATPMGQIYDIASTHLVGKSTMTDTAALRGIEVSDGLGVTGFESKGQRLIFISNMTDQDGSLSLAELRGKHVAVHHLVAADLPESTWYDESEMVLASENNIIDARADMNVRGGAVGQSVSVGANEMVVLMISDRDMDLYLEGAHNVTDVGSRMVNDVIRGARGDDTIFGHVGDDYLFGRNGDDEVNGGDGSDRIYGGRGEDVLAGGAGIDRITGGAGGDRISGNGGGDHLSGRSGSDKVWGGWGHDTIHGGSDADRLFGGRGDDRIFGASGRDVLRGGSGNDRLSGGTHGDSLRGGRGDDRLAGGSGDDRIEGGIGDDSISGGSGDDLLAGGLGQDTFIFSPFQGRDTISDFDIEDDWLLLKGTSHDDDYNVTETVDGIELEAFGTTVLLSGVFLEDLASLNVLAQ